MSSINIRVGAVLPDDKPALRRHYPGYLSHADCVQMIDKCLSAPSTVRYDIFDAISDNKYRWRATSHATEVLGWAPQGSTETTRSKTRAAPPGRQDLRPQISTRAPPSHGIYSRHRLGPRRATPLSAACATARLMPYPEEFPCSYAPPAPTARRAQPLPSYRRKPVSSPRPLSLGKCRAFSLAGWYPRPLTAPPSGASPNGIGKQG